MPHSNDNVAAIEDFRLAQLADGVRAALKDHPSRDGRKHYSDFRFIESIVDDAEVCFGVWFDLTVPSLIGKLLVKGEDVLERIVASGQPRPIRLAAIPCDCPEQAEALRQHIGERASTKH